MLRDNPKLMTSELLIEHLPFSERFSHRSKCHSLFTFEDSLRLRNQIITLKLLIEQSPVSASDKQTIKTFVLQKKFYSQFCLILQIVRGYMDQLKDKIEEETGRANEAEEEAKVGIINLFTFRYLIIHQPFYLNYENDDEKEI